MDVPSDHNRGVVTTRNVVTKALGMPRYAVGMITTLVSSLIKQIIVIKTLQEMLVHNH